MGESTKSSTERSPFTKPGFIILAALVIALLGALMIFLLPKGDRTTQRGRTLNDALKLVLGRKSVHQRHMVAASREAAALSRPWKRLFRYCQGFRAKRTRYSSPPSSKPSADAAFCECEPGRRFRRQTSRGFADAENNT